MADSQAPGGCQVIPAHLYHWIPVGKKLQQIQVLVFQSNGKSFMVVFYVLHPVVCVVLKFSHNYYVFGHYPLSCLYLKKHPVYFSKHNFSETGFCLCFQVKPTQLGPIDRASPYLRTPIQAPRWGIPSQAQHKPSARAKKTLIFKLCTYEALHQKTITIEIITGEKIYSYWYQHKKKNFPLNLHLTEL
jgi:hypothetical protein